MNRGGAISMDFDPFDAFEKYFSFTSRSLTVLERLF